MGRQSELINIQKEILKKSGHAAKMTDIYVHFNSSFINKFCIEYHAGKPAETILAENGIDPVILGKGPKNGRIRELTGYERCQIIHEILSKPDNQLRVK